MVFGIDPVSGAVLWRTQVGVGGFLGGILWGMAADARNLYVANSDVFVAGSGRPGLFALNPATGKDIWYAPTPKVPCSWTSGAPCFNAQSAAPFAIPGADLRGNHGRPRTRLRRSRWPCPMGFRHRARVRRGHRRQLRLSRQRDALPDLRLSRRPRRKLRQPPACLFRRRPLTRQASGY